MKRSTLGKSILSFVLVVGAVVATAVDWNTTHLFNPAWHPHARFHDALYLLFFDGTSLIALWLLWRQSKEPDVGLKAAALFSAAAWTPFFYIEALIPGTSLLRGRQCASPEGREHDLSPESHRCRRAVPADGYRLLAGPRHQQRCVNTYGTTQRRIDSGPPGWHQAALLITMRRR